MFMDADQNFPNIRFESKILKIATPFWRFCENTKKFPRNETENNFIRSKLTKNLVGQFLKISLKYWVFEKVVRNRQKIPDTDLDHLNRKKKMRVNAPETLKGDRKKIKNFTEKLSFSKSRLKVHKKYRSWQPESKTLRLGDHGQRLS